MPWFRLYQNQFFSIISKLAKILIILYHLQHFFYIDRIIILSKIFTTELLNFKYRQGFNL